MKHRILLIAILIVSMLAACSKTPASAQMPSAAADPQAVTPLEHPEDIFPSTAENHVTANTICYAEAPYAESRDFSLHQAQLLEQQVIPEMPDYNTFSATANYHADGSVFELILYWQYIQTDSPTYRQLNLRICPQEPVDKEKRDGMLLFDRQEVKGTEIDGVTVYADGNDDTIGKFLVFTLPDGSYCQISAIWDSTCQDTMTVLRFLLEHGINYDAFAKDLGDVDIPAEPVSASY